ncbi:MAG: hypothetical protein V4660_07170 [Pseudomonadota bacterium]
MSLLGLVLSVIGLLMLALFQFMLVAFSGGGLANGNKLSSWTMSVLNISIYLLPALSVFTAAALIYFYVSDSAYLSLKWHFLPLSATVAYYIFVMNQK